LLTLRPTASVRRKWIFSHTQTKEVKIPLYSNKLHMHQLHLSNEILGPKLLPWRQCSRHIWIFPPTQTKEVKNPSYSHINVWQILIVLFLLHIFNVDLQTNFCCTKIKPYLTSKVPS
jgi:hypothetical protein